MNLCEKFLAVGEYYAAGLFEEEDRGIFYRKSLAMRRFFENCPLPEYHGEKVYPCGEQKAPLTVKPVFYFDHFGVDHDALNAKDPTLLEPLLEVKFGMMKFFVTRPHGVFGTMSSHSVPCYERVLAEGLDAYEERVRRMKNEDMREGLLQLIAGIRAYHTRCLDYLVSVNADPLLINALRVVPFQKSHNIFEALISWNFIMYMECGMDMHPGNIAQGLMPYYNGEDPALLEAYLRDMYKNVDANDGWSVSLGLEDNPLNTVCLRAGKDFRRPLTELFVDENTPDEVWDAALDSVLSGCGQPAFFNKTLYAEGHKERLGIPDEDLKLMCGGGCAEIMVSGKSNIGTMDESVHLLYVLEQTIYDYLPRATSFDDFYEYYIDRLHDDALVVMDEIYKTQEHRAKNCPYPMRTLLTEGCIDRELDYNAGGTDYCWSMVGFGGIVNAIDSLMVIRDKIFKDRTYTPEQMIDLLKAEDEAFLAECKRHPHRHGIDDDETNALARDLTTRVFAFTKERTPYIGTAFVPCTVMFSFYHDGGAVVGATPCGRHAKEPIADSLAAIFGKDDQGPTAMLKSVASIDLAAVIGTPIVNLTVEPTINRDILKSLIQSFMKMGGMQLQITCVDKETIRKAYENPEDYKNLIVRVGGFCEYYGNLHDKLRKKLLERTYYK